MSILLISILILLIGGYFYSKLAKRIYAVDLTLKLPAETHPDGVDNVALPTWRIFLIQLLNIAGLGPVLGALSGCLFGPVALIWIVVGCILFGALHDYLAAQMSAEHDGASLPDLIGDYLGRWARATMRVLCVLLLILVGVVFTKAPAAILHNLMDFIPLWAWFAFILAYYILATVLPIQTIIGRIYPYFAILFILMAISVFVALIFSDIPILPDRDFSINMHPAGLPVWPMICVTIACGAISGFHATQSPLMVRCLKSVKSLRRVFFGAMIIEGIIALIWACVGLSLRELLLESTLINPALSVNIACHHLLGEVGGMIAILGVVVLPITSGDTAMRSCRLILSETFRVHQEKTWMRLLLISPIIVLVIMMSQFDFAVVWRYFGWANQLIAVFTLWTIAVLIRRRGNWHWLATIPACFMTCMCMTYILHDAWSFNLDIMPATLLGSFSMLICLFAFYKVTNKWLKEQKDA